MALTPTEQTIPVARLAGQRGREPVGSVPLDSAAVANGTLHDAEFLSSADGSVKLIATPFPQSAYELRGALTGIIEVPIPTAYDAAFNFAIGAADKFFGVSVVLKLLDLGNVPDGATDDGQIIISTATVVGANPDGGADIESIRLGLVLASGVYKLRLKWGTSTTDLSLASLDLSRDLVVAINGRRGIGANTLEFRAWDGVATAASGSVAAARDVAVDWIHVGGELASRSPFFGIQSPCACVVSQVLVLASTNSTNPPTGDPGDDVLTARLEAGVSTATGWLDAFNCDEVGDHLTSVEGFDGWVVGNRIHRVAGLTSAQEGAIRCDGTGALSIPRAARTRKADPAIPGHYTELDDWSYAVWLAPDRTPSVHHHVERACFTCWSTPYAANMGVASDPLSGSYPDSTRPSEHLRLEIRHVGTEWYVYAFFGELEPQSLKHPSGTPGGSSSTTWPPALANAQVPPATWNQPEDDPTALYSDADGKTAFRVLLGDDGDATHPMDYRWLVIAQRKFVAQSDAGNACAVYVRRYSAAGILDTGFGEVDDANSDSGERHPADQSCFTAARINGNDICLRPDAYVFAIGAGMGSQFGDEETSYDGSTRRPGLYPMDSDTVPYRVSDQSDAFGFRGVIGSPTLLSRYLTARDRQLIAEAGGFDGELLDQFRDSIAFSYGFAEPAGTIARDARGNDAAYADKAGVAVVEADVNVDLPQLVGCFPRPEPSWHGQAASYVNEYGRVNGIAQRIGSAGTEELYAIGQAGIYQYDRDTHALTRVGTLPGQGGPGQCSITVDVADVIHVAGGSGRPVMVTREKVIAVSGLDTPIYPVPSETITANKVLAGGMSLTFAYVVNANPLLLAGFEYDDQSVAQFAIGYWSDLLKTRSRPGGRITAKYSAPSIALGVFGPNARSKYRLSVTGLPMPKGPNAHLVTHWEIYRTDPNGTILQLEKRVPISDGATAVIGDIQVLGEEADYLRDVPPEGMRTITAFDRRLVGASTPEFPRSIWYTKLDDSGAWPPIYRRNLVQTPSPARGVVVRRDRAFAFSDDHMYQLLDGRVDADLGQGIVESVDLSPTVKGCGAVSQMAVVDDDQNGIYMPGGKTVHLTEGGTYRSVSQHNDAADTTVDEDRWLWPTSWDMSDGHEFVGFHDERRRMVGICGPSSDDPDRRDLVQLFYEQSVLTTDGREIPIGVEMSRVRGVDMTCAASVINPDTKQREIWFGTSKGYVCKRGDSVLQGVDYSWLDTVAPACGQVLSVPSTTVLRLEGSWSAYPAADLFRGAMLRLYRDNELVFEAPVSRVTVSASWADVTFDSAHGGLPGDTFAVGNMPMKWHSGKFDGGALTQDKSIVEVDITMVD